MRGPCGRESRAEQSIPSIIAISSTSGGAVIIQSSNLPIFPLPLPPSHLCRPGYAASRYPRTLTPLRAMTCGSQLCHQRFRRAFGSLLSSSKPTWFHSPGASCRQAAVVQSQLRNPNVILPASTQKGPASRLTPRRLRSARAWRNPILLDPTLPVSSYPTTAA